MASPERRRSDADCCENCLVNDEAVQFLLIVHLIVYGAGVKGIDYTERWASIFVSSPAEYAGHRRMVRGCGADAGH